MHTLALALMLLAPAARAGTVVGSDYGGADFTPAAGDILSGTFTNIRKFTIPSGQTNTVASGVTLQIYASTVAIYGTLDGSGSGQDGGNLGSAGMAGSSGFDGGAKSEGGEGAGGAAGQGGGGGSSAGAGGAGGGGASAGAVYGSSGVYVSIPLSADDVAQGSGGGGGGGGTVLSGGPGSAGGGAIYIEASSMTINGSILVPGATAASVTEFSNQPAHPAAGGGGSGGTILLRVTGALDMRGAVLLSANGGKGGDVNTNFGGSLYPGGGGGGGWIKLFSNSANYGTSVALSTAAGAAGFRQGAASGSDGSPAPTSVSSGSVNYGTIASPPSAPGVTATTANSITWTWTATPAFGDGPSTQMYRLFSSTGAPMPSPTITSAVVGVTEGSLQPDTTYQRVITAYTDWGDSHPTGFISTHTLANAPVAGAFTNVAATSLTANWTASNQSYTRYEVNRALDANFGVSVSTTNPLVAVSSSPANLTPNTTYFFRARAINCDNVPTAYTATMAQATLGAVPTSLSFPNVYVTSVTLSWSGGANPAGTTFIAVVSTDSFQTIVVSATTTLTSSTFTGLTPNTNYSFEVYSVNVASAASAPSSPSSTRLGNLSDLTAPGAPGTPFADRQFSYDGTMTFMWSAAQSSVGILDYNLLIGSSAGGNDVFNGTVNVASASLSGLATGKSYFAEVRARANNGVVGPFSNISVGVPVFIPGGTAAINKPYNWPNPFNPATGSTQIGVFMDTAGTAVLKIYTLDGRLVHQQSTDVGQGNQVLTWNGRSDSGGTVAPGGYIGVIEKRMGSGSSTQKFKMAVLY